MNHPHLMGVQLIHLQALPVQRDGLYPGAAAGEDAVGLAVARVLHTVSALAAQQLHQQADKGLRSGAHHDLVRVCPDAPEAVKVCRDGLPQLRYTLRVGGGQQPVLLPRQRSRFVRNLRCVRDVRFPVMAFCAREGMENVCAHE